MKQWKLVLVALLSVLLVCISVGALAETTTEHKDTHQTEENWSLPTIVNTGKYEGHQKVYTVETYCLVCKKVVDTREEVVDEAHTLQGVTVPSTCTVYGTYKEVCPVCGYETPTSKLTTLADHQPVEHKAVDPICGEKDGNEAYWTCKTCDTMWNADVSKVITAVPVIKAKEAHNFVSDPAQSVPATCEEDGYIVRECQYCGKVVKEKQVKTGHNYSDAGWEEVKAPSCYEVGYERNLCTICGMGEQLRELPKVGHTYAAASKLAKKAAGEYTEGKVVKASTCEKAGSGYLYCLVCGVDGAKETEIPAGGHKWSDWVVESRTLEELCTKDKKATRTCADCGKTETMVVDTAKGHQWIVISGTAATCTEAGKGTRVCVNCGLEEKDVDIPATGHSYEWVEVSKPSKDGDGVSELVCTVCGDVAETKTTPYSEMRYNNTISAFGPCTRDLIGGKEWARVTPIDLSVEGTFTYPLIASNVYNVGTATVTISNGTFTVTYKLNSKDIKVNSESLVCYANLEALRTGAGTAIAFGAPVTIGEDTKVILAVNLKADYNAVGAGVSPFKADAAQVEAMKAIID
jgi:hypothetical protein